MSLRGTYAWALKVATDYKFNGTIDERNGKLHIKGTVDTQDQANKIWDAIKTIPTWSQDIVADVQATGKEAPMATYTVKAGDTLTAIAKHFDATVDELKKWNSLTTTKLSVGDRLTIHKN